jgi:DNA (cytosine-5)-methyltransferase 1
VALLPTPVADNSRGLPSDGTDYQSLMNTVMTLLPTPAVNDMGAAYTPEQWDAWTAEMKAKHNNGNGHGKSLNVEAQRLLPTPTRRDHKDTEVRREPHRPDDVDTLSRALADTLTDATVRQPDRLGEYGPALRRWAALTRPMPEPTKPNAKGNPKLSDDFDEWFMGYPEGWITDVPGVTWNETLKACGNGVVPQQGAAAVRWLLVMGQAVAA